MTPAIDKLNPLYSGLEDYLIGPFRINELVQITLPEIIPSGDQKHKLLEFLRKRTNAKIFNPTDDLVIFTIVLRNSVSGQEQQLPVIGFELINNESGEPLAELLTFSDTMDIYETLIEKLFNINELI